MILNSLGEHVQKGLRALGAREGGDKTRSAADKVVSPVTRACARLDVPGPRAGQDERKVREGGVAQHAAHLRTLSGASSHSPARALRAWYASLCRTSPPQTSTFASRNSSTVSSHSVFAQNAGVSCVCRESAPACSAGTRTGRAPGAPRCANTAARTCSRAALAAVPPCMRTTGSAGGAGRKQPRSSARRCAQPPPGHPPVDQTGVQAAAGRQAF